MKRSRHDKIIRKYLSTSVHQNEGAITTHV